jgi:hypothetical protein
MYQSQELTDDHKLILAKIKNRVEINLAKPETEKEETDNVQKPEQS